MPPLDALFLGNSLQAWGAPRPSPLSARLLGSRYGSVDTMAGTVERVGLKTTRVRALSGKLVIFSNADLLRSRACATSPACASGGCSTRQASP
jgi:hypothetical protein